MSSRSSAEVEKLRVSAFRIPVKAVESDGQAAAGTGQFHHVQWTLEWDDHVRIEQMLFDGAAKAEGGMLTPDLSRPGLGIEFKHADARPYLIS